MLVPYVRFLTKTKTKRSSSGCYFSCTRRNVSTLPSLLEYMSFDLGGRHLQEMSYDYLWTWRWLNFLKHL
jgi:hypothetical protein